MWRWNTEAAVWKHAWGVQEEDWLTDLRAYAWRVIGRLPPRTKDLAGIISLPCSRPRYIDTCRHQHSPTLSTSLTTNPGTPSLGVSADTLSGQAQLQASSHNRPAQTVTSSSFCSRGFAHSDLKMDSFRATYLKFHDFWKANPSVFNLLVNSEFQCILKPNIYFRYYLHLRIKS